MTWHTGPEVRSTANRMEPWPQPDEAAVAKLPQRSQAELLDAIRHSIYTQPPTDWSKVTNLGVMRAVPEVKETVNLAQQYVNLRLRPAGAYRAARRDRLPRQFHRDARLQASPGDRRGIPRDARAVALDAPRLRRPGGGDLVRQEHDDLRAVSRTAARRVIDRQRTGGRTPPSNSGPHLMRPVCFSTFDFFHGLDCRRCALRLLPRIKSGVALRMRRSL